jgi:hypothetical protein
MEKEKVLSVELIEKGEKEKEERQEGVKMRQGEK